MAFRRSVTARAKFFYQQQQRVAVPLSHIDRHDNDDRRRQNYLWLRDNISGSSNLFRDRRFSIPAAYAPVFVRNMSSRGEAIGTEIMNHEAADLLGENAIEAVVAPVANEVAAAATATGFSPVDAVQHSIDYLHSFTGMNWWASIAVATILIRTILLPLEILQMKTISKFDDVTARKRKLCDKSYRNLVFTRYVAVIPLGDFIIALFNMTSEVASFKDEGAFWFTDLTTPDAMHILPILTAFTFWRAMEIFPVRISSKT
ncbi:hypothetical protein C2S53_018582 [Perilla frutescens var. hirtella]|uniref:Uncharacterized protein n=1 Tax=Perilla frutescens var. hirtella TaxID=608512 RepID=A0AAD4P0C8_PERFH|nr:hypothetical protein C2S53_018582 [Perilla frutescens var. hirtella]